MIGKTVDQVITSWNPGAERLFGYTAKEMIGRHIEVLIPLEDRKGEAKVAAVAQGERVEQYQTRRIRKDGTPVDVSLTLSPIADRAGAIVGVATVARDLTDRQRAEARFRGLMEAAPDAMVCVDRDGRIALVNAQTERLFGYRRDELVGQPVEILVPDKVRGLHPGHRAGYMTDPRPRPMGAQMQLAGRRRDGASFPAEVSMSAIDTDEGILVTAVVRDVTERLEIQAERERLRTQAERDKLERHLHQSQRLESLGQLAGGVAHDFNNLLGVISNYAAFAGEEVAKQAPDGRWQIVHDDIEQVKQAAERAAGLTHQLLAFARQEVIQPRVLNINDVVESVEQLLVRTLGEHVELITDLADDLSPVLADPGQIEQVLVNLAVNARDAMPGGGKLTIQTANTDIDDTIASQTDMSPGRYVAVKVTDTGTGMPKDVVDRVFEPFFTTKPKGEGTGLGLATVYGIITQAGGRVRIYSETGMGTILTALLPVTSKLPTSRRSRPPNRSAVTARGCWSSKTKPPCERSPAGSWPATATRSWRPPAATKHWMSSPANWSTSTCCSLTSSCRTCREKNSPTRSASSSPTSGWCSCPAIPRAFSARKASSNLASTSSKNHSPKPPCSPNCAKSSPPTADRAGAHPQHARSSDLWSAGPPQAGNGSPSRTTGTPPPSWMAPAGWSCAVGAASAGQGEAKRLAGFEQALQAGQDHGPATGDDPAERAIFF